MIRRSSGKACLAGFNRPALFVAKIQPKRNHVTKDQFSQALKMIRAFAHLRSADLSSANLSSADLKKLLPIRTILPEGDLIVWKKLQDEIVCKLKIPENAQRVGGLIGRKCRAEFAIVLEGEGRAQHDGTVYKIGETIKPDSYDPNPLVECSHGIHFFITKEEAEAY